MSGAPFTPDHLSYWQSRRGGVRVYFCCCPFALILAPPLLLGRLVQYGILRLLGRPTPAFWPPQPADRAFVPGEPGR